MSANSVTVPVLTPAIASWVDNVLACKDGTLMTVFSDGSVEVRGPGWAPRRNSKRARAYGRNFDCRVLKLWTEAKARQICELVALNLAGVRTT